MRVKLGFTVQELVKIVNYYQSHHGEYARIPDDASLIVEHDSYSSTMVRGNDEVEFSFDTEVETY